MRTSLFDLGPRRARGALPQEHTAAAMWTRCALRAAQLKQGGNQIRKRRQVGHLCTGELWIGG